jgi:hypothetical protein
MSTANRKIKRRCRAEFARLLPQFHLKPNAAWRARKRWKRQLRNKHADR